MSQAARQRKRDALRNLFSRWGSPSETSAGPPGSRTSSPIRRTSTLGTDPSGRAPSTSFTCESFSEAALRSLTPGEQARVRRHLADDGGGAGDAIQKTLDAVLRLRQDCDGERGRIAFRGRNIDLRDEADKVIHVMKRFLSIGDVVANVDPIHIGLPWAGIRIILEVAVADSRQRAALLEGMRLAMSMADRLRSYLGYRTRLQDTPTTLTFEKALLRMYVLVLQFFDSAITTYQKTKAARIWAALWADSNLDEFERKCQDWAVQVGLDADNCERELSSKGRDHAEHILEDITTAMSDVSIGQRDDRYCRILDWLSPPDPQYNHQAACRKRTPHTGDWVLRSPEYEAWKNSGTENRLLWLTGKAGCGKTVLCSTVIEDIRVGLPDVRLAFFYFSFSDTQKQSYTSMLLSLVAQLSHSKAGVDEMGHLYDRYHPNRPTPEALEDTLSKCMQVGSTILVLDALDELPEYGHDGRSAVATWLGSIVQRGCPVRVFITGRHLLSIEDLLKPLDTRCVFIRAGIIKDDIRRYVTTEIEKDPKLRAFDMDTKEKIKAVLLRKSDGMFRWVFCQLQEIKRLKLTGPKHIENCLQSLPSTLDETYERMLLEIDGSFFCEALRALQWLTFVSRPLTLEELAEACLIDHTSEPFLDVSYRGRVEGILDLLTGLVIVDDPPHTSGPRGIGQSQDCGGEIADPPGDDTSHDDLTMSKIPFTLSRKSRVRLAHFSVREYLVSDRILSSKTARQFALEESRDRQTLAQSCLAYLINYSRSSLKSGSKEENINNFPLLQFAAESWFKLISKELRSQPIHEMTLLRSREYKEDWLSKYNPEWPGMEDLQLHQPDTAPGLHYACLVGLLSAARSLIELGEDVNAQGGRYGTALQAALAGGHHGIFKLLLGSGADVNVKGGEYGNALQAACRLGYREEVKLLLDSGAEVNAQGGFYVTALQAASHGGHREIVRLLIDSGAEINVQARDGEVLSNALQAASCEGHLEVVRLLLKKGADVDARGHYGTPLQAASRGGFDEIVELLLNSGADARVESGYYGYALSAASRGGHFKVVELLLDGGAEINAGGGIYMNNPLQAACEEGCLDIVELLLDRGADLNIQGGRYGNALQAASGGGHGEVVTLLLDNGADVNALGDMGSALLIASASGRHRMVKLLLNSGADIDAQGRLGNALFAASANGRQGLVKLLLNRGADVNAQGKLGSALSAASAKGHRGVVKLLLDHGADVNAKGGKYDHSALFTAVYHGQREVVKLLLNRNAEVNSQEGDFGTVLHVAACVGAEETVQQLIKQHADTTAQDQHGWTPGMIASAYRFNRLMELFTPGLNPTNFPPVSKPSALVCTTTSSEIGMSKDGLNVDTEHVTRKELKNTVQYRSNHPIPFGLDNFYFEVTVLCGGHDNDLGIGVCDQYSSRTGMPGWYKGSWGYHGDDGYFYSEHGKGSKYGPAYGEGDVIGCGVNREPQSIYFTKNGQHLGLAGSGVWGRQFAVIGTLSKGVKFSINFGLLPFRYIARAPGISAMGKLYPEKSV